MADGEDDDASESFEENHNVRRRKSRAQQPFPQKCYLMVSDPTCASVVGWCEDGESFAVWKLTEFTMEVLPRYFRHSNFSSFVRQLNFYSFRKVGEPSANCFSHPCFRRGRPELLRDITRQKPPVKKPSAANAQRAARTLRENNDNLQGEVESLREQLQIQTEQNASALAAVHAENQLLLRELRAAKDAQVVMQTAAHALVPYLTNVLQGQGAVESALLAGNTFLSEVQGSRQDIPTALGWPALQQARGETLALPPLYKSAMDGRRFEELPSPSARSLPRSLPSTALPSPVLPDPPAATTLVEPMMTNGALRSGARSAVVPAEKVHLTDDDPFLGPNALAGDGLGGRLPPLPVEVAVSPLIPVSPFPARRLSSLSREEMALSPSLAANVVDNDILGILMSSNRAGLRTSTPDILRPYLGTSWSTIAPPSPAAAQFKRQRTPDVSSNHLGPSGFMLPGNTPLFAGSSDSAYAFGGVGVGVGGGGGGAGAGGGGGLGVSAAVDDAMVNSSHVLARAMEPPAKRFKLETEYEDDTGPAATAARPVRRARPSLVIPDGATKLSPSATGLTDFPLSVLDTGVAGDMEAPILHDVRGMGGPRVTSPSQELAAGVLPDLTEAQQETIVRLTTHLLNRIAVLMEDNAQRHVMAPGVPVPGQVALMAPALMASGGKSVVAPVVAALAGPAAATARRGLAVDQAVFPQTQKPPESITSDLLRTIASDGVPELTQAQRERPLSVLLSLIAWIGSFLNQ